MSATAFMNFLIPIATCSLLLLPAQPPCTIETLQKKHDRLDTEMDNLRTEAIAKIWGLTSSIEAAKAALALQELSGNLTAAEVAAFNIRIDNAEASLDFAVRKVNEGDVLLGQWLDGLPYVTDAELEQSILIFEAQIPKYEGARGAANFGLSIISAVLWDLMGAGSLRLAMP